jgi:hypothetical protein
VNAVGYDTFFSELINMFVFVIYKFVVGALYPSGYRPGFMTCVKHLFRTLIKLTPLHIVICILSAQRKVLCQKLQILSAMCGILPVFSFCLFNIFMHFSFCSKL